MHLDLVLRAPRCRILAPASAFCGVSGTAAAGFSSRGRRVMLCLVLMAVELVIVSTAPQSANYTAYKPSTGRPPLQLPRVEPLAPFRHGRQARVAERGCPRLPGPLHTPQGRARPQVTPPGSGAPLSPPFPRDPPTLPGPQGCLVAGVLLPSRRV